MNLFLFFCFPLSPLFSSSSPRSFGVAVRTEWDARGGRTLRGNLEACLGVSLPCPATPHDDEVDFDERHGFTATCAICYAYRLNGGEGSDHAETTRTTDKRMFGGTTILFIA